MKSFILGKLPTFLLISKLVLVASIRYLRIGAQKNPSVEGPNGFSYLIARSLIRPVGNSVFVNFEEFGGITVNQDFVDKISTFD